MDNAPRCSYCGREDLQNLYTCESDECARDTARCDSWCSECKVGLPCGVPNHVSCWEFHISRIEVPELLAAHVKYPVRDQIRMAQVFAGEIDPQKQQAQLESNRAARWFMVDQGTIDPNAGGTAFGYGTLIVTDRFETLTTRASCTDIQPNIDLFPSLVSFIGETGAGKSTLIKGLIQLTPEVQSPELLEAPVTRCTNTGYITAPTTEGVNLYRDPSTAASQNPILFADCEGFGAGAAKGLLPAGDGARKELTVLDEIEISTKSEIGANCSRSQAIENLYARFLYAFSDVVCFVTKDAQTVAAQMEQLLLWVAGAFKAAINLQPTKTLIVIFNKSDIYDQRWMDEDQLAKDTIDQLGNVWTNSPTLQRLVEENDFLASVTSTKQLLLKYFRSVRVCYFPAKSLARKSEIIRQWATLRKQITDSSTAAGEARKGTWAQYSLEELSSLFSEAWRHFAGVNTPFNFYSAAQRDSFNPMDITGHLMNLLRHMKKDNTPGLVVDFPRIVASAFINDCFPLPRGNTIFPPAQRWEETYMTYCNGISEFYVQHSQCRFVHKGRRCSLVSTSHAGIHQDSNGKAIGKGTCETGEPENAIDDMCGKVEAEFIRQCEAVNLIGPDGVIKNPRPSASDILKHRVEVFQGLDNDWSGVHSYKTCFTCLSSVPDHVLPCGHAFCEDCIHDFGELSDDTKAEVFITTCAWCKRLFNPSQIIQTKPPCAGIRILTLDGGGIRGILELALLKLVEDKIDLGLGIQVFFDLIIGTSTGGIIALGLVTKNLSSTDMIDKFQAIAERAFYYLRTNLILSMYNTQIYGEYVDGMVKKINSVLPTFGSTKSSATKPKPAAKPKPAPSQNLFTSLRTRVTTQLDKVSLSYPPPPSTNQFSLFYGQLDTIRKRSIYPTKPLKIGLREVLGPDTTMFGSAIHTGEQRLTRLAVLAVKNRGRTPCGIANYNRRDLARGGDFERSENDEYEFKAWEAGLSTSAAPGYFKRFRKKETSKDYVDGALYHNNPILWALDEYRKIWEHANSPAVMLDIVVSVGTGNFPEANKASNEPGKEPSSDSFIDSLTSLFSRLKGEETWRKFVDTAADYDPKVHYRLNVDIPGGACKLDQFRKMRSLLSSVNDAFNGKGLRRDWQYFGQHLRDKISDISELLVAKLFFFYPTQELPDADEESHKLTGHILCRLRKDEKSLKKLVERIEGFFIVDWGRSLSGRKLAGVQDMKTRVRNGERFGIDITIETKDPEKQIEIFVVMKAEPSRRIPISGFPRKFYSLRSACKETRK